MKTLVRTIALITVISLSCVCLSGEPEEKAERARIEAQKLLQKKQEEAQSKLSKLQEVIHDLATQRHELDRNQEELRRQLAELEMQRAEILETLPQVHAPILETLPQAQAPAMERMSGIFLAKGRGGQSADISVVITSEDEQPVSIAQLTEDMGIMVRIFDKEVFEIPVPKQRTMGFGDVNLYMYTGAVKQNRTRGIYISEYGALFLMDVDFPLKPEPIEEEKEEEKAEAPDVWEQTKGELKGWYQGPGPEPGIKIDKIRLTFDEDKVKELKEKIIRTLKYASNIRGLEPGDNIIVSVKSRIHRGSETTSEIKILGPRGGVQTGGGGGYGGGFGRGGGYGGAFAGSGYGGAFVGSGFDEDISPKKITGMTIIVDKGDVDSFAEGDIDYEEFLEDVEIIEY